METNKIQLFFRDCGFIVLCGIFIILVLCGCATSAVQDAHKKYVTVMGPKLIAYSVNDSTLDRRILVNRVRVHNASLELIREGEKPALSSITDWFKNLFSSEEKPVSIIREVDLNIENPPIVDFNYTIKVPTGTKPIRSHRERWHHQLSKVF